MRQQQFLWYLLLLRVNRDEMTLKTNDMFCVNGSLIFIILASFAFKTDAF